MTARLVGLSLLANCTLIARERLERRGGLSIQLRSRRVTWAFSVERVTGIEPALSAWE